jgi:hypothetical protein
MSTETKRAQKPLRTEAYLFAGSAVIFLVLAAIYAYLTQIEPVGVVALLLLGGLGGLVGAYLWVLGNRVDPRPEDNPLAEIEEGAGEVGAFSPWSWWPLVLGISVALVFLGLALGFWISAVGAVLAVIGLVGLLFEFSRGQHAH